MEAFVLHCTTCRTRLRVNDPAAIGQIVSCPKCHSMVQIAAPPGWSSEAVVMKDSAPVKADIPPAAKTPAPASQAVTAPLPLPPPEPPTIHSDGDEFETSASDVTQRGWLLAAGGIAGVFAAATSLWLALGSAPEPPLAPQPQEAKSEAPLAPSQPAPEIASPSTAPQDVTPLDPRWIPDSACVITSFQPARLSELPAAMVWLERLAPLWPAVWQPLAAQFRLQPAAVHRIVCVQTRPGAAAAEGLTLVSFAQALPSDAWSEAAAVAELKSSWGSARRFKEGAWPHAFVVIDERTLLTGPDSLLTEVLSRGAAQPPNAKLVDLALRGADRMAALAVDLNAWRAAGITLNVPELDLVLDAAPPWRALFASPLAAALWLDSAEALSAELRLVGSNETATLDLENTWQQAIAATRPYLEAQQASLETRLQRGELTPAVTDQFETVLASGAEALNTATAGHEGDEFWARLKFGGTARELFAATAGCAPVWQLDQRAAQNRLAVAHHRAAAQGVLARQRAEGEYPSGAGGAVQLRPDSRLSWIASLLPYYGYRDRHKQLNFFHSWNDPVNRAAALEPLPEFVNPLLGASRTEAGFSVTHYVGVAGLGADAGDLPADDPRAGVFGFRRTLAPTQVVDGASHTVALLGVNDRLGPWAAGGDATVRALTQAPYVNGPDGFGSGQPDGMYAAMLDGSIRFVSKDVDPRVLEQLATINGGGKPSVDLAALPTVDEQGEVAKVSKTATAPEEPLAAEVPAQPPMPPVEPQPAGAPGPAGLSEAEIAARLEMRVPAITTEATPLAELVELLTDLTTVSISLDVDALSAEGIGVADPVQVKLEDATAAQVLQAAIDRLRLVYSIEPGQVVVTTAARLGTELSERSYDVTPLLAAPAQREPEQLAALVRRFVAPETWEVGGGKGTLKLHDGRLLVRQMPAVHRELAGLLARLVKLQARPTSDTTEPTNRATQTAARLAAPITVSHPQPVSLARLLADFQAASGTNLVVDHRALESLGLTDAAEVSLRAERQPLGEALSAALTPLDLTWRAVDAQTLQITSRAALEATLETELYPIGPELRKKFEPEALEEAIRRDVAPIQWQPTGGAGDLLYDPASRTLLVLNNQQVQRQIIEWLREQANSAEAAKTD